jgi:dihydroorotate dehydrogenase (NAD+) catalytic subunit
MIEISAGKQALRLSNPVIGASGAFGFAGEYAKLIDLSLLGALVTNPITLKPRRPSTGTRVVALESGALVHTGLPNPGLYKVHRQYAARWRYSPTPIIVHLIGNTPDDLAECAQFLDRQEDIMAIELGLYDQATHRDARLMVGAVREHTQLPLLVKVPLYQALHVAAAAVDAGADALVVAGPPRGTTRDPYSGELAGGRMYGPWLKPLALRATGQIAAHVKVPLIGCGGIHDPADARDFLEAGAVAVQVDSVAWSVPGMVAVIARDLSGLEHTRAAGALPDEWDQNPDESVMRRSHILPSPPPLIPPGKLPES